MLKYIASTKFYIKLHFEMYIKYLIFNKICLMLHLHVEKNLYRRKLLKFLRSDLIAISPTK